MDSAAVSALKQIQECVALDRIRVLPHFVERMDHRGLFWPDVVAVIEAPDEVREAGLDDYARPRWIIAGAAADDLPVEIVCVLDQDDQGQWTVFITLYWQE